MSFRLSWLSALVLPEEATEQLMEGRLHGVQLTWGLLCFAGTQIWG